MSWMEFQEADPITSAVIVTLGQFPVAVELQVSALRAAIEVLEAASDLEAKLTRSGEYVVTADTMTKVRDRS